MCYLIANFVIMTKHIGREIKTVFEESGLSKSEFARRINKSRETIYDIFERQSIDTGLLKAISEVLKHDFFLHYTIPND